MFHTFTIPDLSLLKVQTDTERFTNALFPLDFCVVISDSTLMAVVQRIPQKLEEVLGREGSNEFIDFLNVTFHSQEELVIQLVEDKFEKTVTEEVSKVRLEVAKLDTKIAELRAEVKTDIGKLDTKIAEIRTEIANLRAEMKSDIAKVHESISSQTKWIFGALVGAAVLFPIVSGLIKKFLP